MDSLEIKSGEVELCINKDESRVIRFNPSDNLFAEKFYRAMGEAQVKMIAYQRRAEELEAVKETDENDIPVNMQERFTFLQDTCTDLRTLIDSVFGTGTSQTVFGDVNNLDMFSQFLDGIAPYFQKARAAKVSQYIPHSQKPQKRTRRK